MNRTWQTVLCAQQGIISTIWWTELDTHSEQNLTDSAVSQHKQYQICLKSDCKSAKLYKLMSPQEQHLLKNQILVPTFLFSQFETKSTGEKLVSDEYSYKVALYFQFLTKKFKLLSRQKSLTWLGWT